MWNDVLMSNSVEQELVDIVVSDQELNCVSVHPRSINNLNNSWTAAGVMMNCDHALDDCINMNLSCSTL